MRSRSRRLASFFALVLAGVASMATSPAMQPPRPTWQYSESATPQIFDLDGSTPTTAFNVSITTSPVMTGLFMGEIRLVGTATAATGGATLFIVTTDPAMQHTAGLIELEEGVISSFELGGAWLETCDADGCRGNVALSFELEAGASLAGDFELTVIGVGQADQGEGEQPPPDGSDMTIEVTQL